jgi:PadR family transcriptional regulator
MSSDVNLGQFEQLALLAILRLDDGAYGVSIRDEIHACTGRKVSAGALYTTLNRLEDKGLVGSRLGPPTAERGGRAKRFYTVTGTGRKALVAVQRSYQSLMHGLEIFAQ